jgi:hypothetical protein
LKIQDETLKFLRLDLNHTPNRKIEKQAAKAEERELPMKNRIVEQNRTVLVDPDGFEGLAISSEDFEKVFRIWFDRFQIEIPS